MKLRIPFCFLLIFIVAHTSAQESNYANYEVGSKATMLGGAVVAGIDNISAAYYNPGALAFINNSSVSIGTSTLFAGALNIKNGAGSEINIRSSFFNVIPSLIGGVVKSQKSPDWTFAYSVMTVNSSLIEFNVRHYMVADVVGIFPGQEYYEGGYDYRNKINENWLGVSASRVIGEKFGIGVSIYGTSYFQDFSRRQLAIITGRLNNVPVTLASTSITQDLRFRSLGLIIKAGANYQYKNHQIGLTITSPKINIDLFAKGMISSVILQINPLIVDPAASVIYYGEDLPTYHKTPLKLALGYQINMTHSLFSFVLSFNSQVKQYEMITSDALVIPEVGLVRPVISAYDKVNQVFNFSVGYRNDISEGLSLLLGAKTDFNYVDEEFLSQVAFIPKMSYWDLYHFTGGLIWYNDRANITLGADYAFGLSNGDLQQVNLSDPVAEEFYFGERTRDTKTFHNQVNVVLGFMFKFLE